MFLLIVAATLWDFGWAWPGRLYSPFWPSVGISLALILHLGPRYLPAVGLGTFSACALVGLPLVSNLCLTAVSLLIPGLAHPILQRMGFSADVPRTRNAVQLMTVGVLILPAALGPLATWGLIWGGLVGEELFNQTSLEVSLAMSSGVVLLSPFIISFFQFRLAPWSRWKKAEMVLLLLGTVFITRWIFTHTQSLTFPISLLVVWSATRFQTRGNTSVQLLIGIVAAYFTVIGEGPFGLIPLAERLRYLQLFIITISVVGLFLSTSMKAEAFKQLRLDSERQKAELLEKTKTEAILRESEQNFRLIADTMPNLVWTNFPDGKVQFLNRRWVEITGYNIVDIERRFFENILHPDDRDYCRELWTRSLETGEAYEIEYRLRQIEGDYRWHLGRAVPVRDAQGQILKWFGTATDIHDQKCVVEELKVAQVQLQLSHQRLESAVAERTADLKQALAEKELLLREIHHRVKNNLNIVSSLLSLQSRQFEDARLNLAFKESQNRINSIAVVHEKLYRSNHLGEIKLSGYIRQLVRNLLVTFGVTDDRISFEVDTDGIELTVELAIPCGLIVNELVSNCLKHAFPENRAGKIWIRMAPTESLSHYELSVTDNGIGIGVVMEPRRTPSLGLQIVNTLGRQLGGEIQVTRVDDRTCVALRFPIQGGQTRPTSQYDWLTKKVWG